MRSPDAAWVVSDRWNALTEEQQRYEFSPIAPDFVVELRSSSDDLETLQTKMQEYRDNQVRLGWLIDPQQRQVEIYRIGQSTEVLQSPTVLSGEDVLPGFELNLKKVCGVDFIQEQLNSEDEDKKKLQMFVDRANRLSSCKFLKNPKQDAISYR